MRNILLRVFINAAALWVVDLMFEKIWFDDISTLIVTAIVFGLLNSFLKPILVLLTLPINLLSLGLFTVVINTAILKLADYLIDGFFAGCIGTAMLASIFISIISIVLNSILKDR